MLTAGMGEESIAEAIFAVASSYNGLGAKGLGFFPMLSKARSSASNVVTGSTRCRVTIMIYWHFKVGLGSLSELVA